jgi:hypothetical protein
MSNTNNALSQLSDNPIWNQAWYSDFDISPSIKKLNSSKFDPNKYKAFFPNYSQKPTEEPTSTSATPDNTIQGPATGYNPIPDDFESRQKELDFYLQKVLPAKIEYDRQLVNEQAKSSYDQMVKSFPLLNQAADIAARRSLWGSQSMASYRDMLPSAVQSRQTAAALSEGERARALASQLIAAKDSWGQGGGNSFRYG